MKNVMKMFIATAVMGIFTVSAFAQGAGPGGQKGQAGGNGQNERKAGGGGGQRRGGMNMDGEIFAKLNLTEGQKTKIKALKESTQKKMQELMKGAGGPGAGAGAGAKGGGKGEAGKGGGFAGMREKFKPIMDSYQAGIKGILTPPQFAAYEKGMKEAREKMKKQFGAGGGPGGVGAKGKGKGSTPPPTA
ncbi:MAG: hypothetical protein WCI55_09175 [Armatimonadota bacterium]